VSASVGDLYYPSDGSNPWVYDGALWRPLVGAAVAGYEPPAAAGFTIVNGAASAFTMTDDAGRLYLTATTQNNAANYYLRGGFVAMTGGVNSASVEGCIESMAHDYSGTARLAAWGVGFRESGTGKIAAIVVSRSQYDGEVAYAARWTGPTATPGAGARWWDMVPTSNRMFLRARLDATNVNFEFSHDRVRWVAHSFNTTKAAAFTTNPDQVGIVCEYFNVNLFPVTAYCLHFRQT
jgi:hypothetical protein